MAVFLILVSRRVNFTVTMGVPCSPLDLIFFGPYISELKVYVNFTYIYNIYIISLEEFLRTPVTVIPGLPREGPPALIKNKGQFYVQQFVHIVLYK